MPTSSFNKHFPGYEILGELGRSNARILKARMQVTGELVAIKHFSFNTDGETLRRFQRESEIMLSVKHPHIVGIKEVQLEAELPYLVMELVEGGDLRSLLKERGHLNTGTVIRLALQMAEAFKAIHSQGITHRDVKPENIMYRYLPGGEPHFLLTDFGIAKLREQSATVTGQSMMTYEYASPEQFDNPKSVNAPTDYYSLGVVIYECLCGKLPFELKEGRVHTLINHVMNTPPPALVVPGNAPLPESMHFLVNALLEKNPATRLHDAVDVTKLLRRAELEESQGKGTEVPVTRTVTKTAVQPPAARPASTHNPLPDSPKQKRKGSVLVYIVIVLAAGLVSMIFINQFRSSTRSAEKNRGQQIRDSVAHASRETPTGRTAVDSAGHFTTGILEDADGRYEGQIWKNLKHGMGTFYYKDGDRYEGYWANDQRSGKGKYYWADGERYEGDWLNGTMYGKGVFFYKSGNTYEGDWVNDMQSGKGNFYFKNGNTFSGEFLNDKWNGYGEFTIQSDGEVNNCPDCKTYKGNWKNDLKDGFGRCYDSTGQLLYEGEFEEDKPIEQYLKADSLKR